MNGSTSSSAKQATAHRPDNAVPVRFRLDGPSRPYDPAIQAIRPDLADIAEAAHHFAPHYAEPVMCVTNVLTGLQERPAGDSAIRAELGAGAGFALLDLSGGWAWGYAVDGHLVGYVPRGRLDLA